MDKEEEHFASLQEIVGTIQLSMNDMAKKNVFILDNSNIFNKYISKIY